jgi:hypothetical protein
MIDSPATMPFRSSLIPRMAAMAYLACICHAGTSGAQVRPGMQALAIPENLTIRCRPIAPDSNQAREWRFELHEEESLSDRSIDVEYDPDDAPLSLSELATLGTTDGLVIRAVILKRTPGGAWAGISRSIAKAESGRLAPKQPSGSSNGALGFEPISDRDRQQALRLLAWLTKHRCGPNLPRG